MAATYSQYNQSALLPLSYTDCNMEDDNTFDDEADDRIVEGGRRTSKIHSNGRGPPVAPQALIVATFKVNPGEYKYRARLWGDERVYAPHADSAETFEHQKGRLGFCVLGPTHMRFTGIPGDTSLESHNVVNGLKVGTKIGMWHVQQLVRKAKENFGDQRQTGVIAGSQTILNTDDAVVHAGQFIYGDPNPVAQVLNGKVEAGFDILGVDQKAMHPRTRGLDTNTVHSLVHGMRSQVLDMVYSVPALEVIDSKTNAVDFFDWFSKTTDTVCNQHGMSEEMPIRALLKVWLPFHWSKIIKLNSYTKSDGPFFALAGAKPNTLGRLQHRVLALNTRLLAQRAIENNARWVKEDFDRGLPHAVPGRQRAHWREASSANSASMFAKELEKLIDVKEVDRLLQAGEALQVMQNLEEAEARLDLNYSHVSEICLYAQQFFFQSQTFARALWTASPGDMMAIHMR